MLYPAARSELVRTTQGLTRKLADLDRWHRESQQLQLEQHVARRQADLDARLCSFRPVAQVDEWKAAHGGVCMRTKFLVLQGPSGLSKTEFARRLLRDAAMTFEINMAAATISVCATLCLCSTGSFCGTRLDHSWCCSNANSFSAQPPGLTWAPLRLERWCIECG